MRFYKGIIILLFLFLFSCRNYRQDILFQVDDTTKLAERVSEVESNYKIQPNDLLKIGVYGQDGEQLIDPNFESPNQQVGNNQFVQIRENQQYLVQTDGTVKFPIVGVTIVEGKTLIEAERELQIKYSEFFKDAFVRLEFLNKRVTVLSQENSMVVPLPNENVKLPEVLALAGGVTYGNKSQNIRIVRGDLTNPKVFVVDLSTVEGMKNSIVPIFPGDIIYIEPWRQPVNEAFRDIAPILSVFTSFATLIVLITTIN